MTIFTVGGGYAGRGVQRADAGGHRQTREAVRGRQEECVRHVQIENIGILSDIKYYNSFIIWPYISI